LPKTLVLALGGNAIKKAEENGTAEEQWKNVRNACEQILEFIVSGYRVVLTHGNGPQAGNLLIQQEDGAELVPPQPLDIVVAMTQGQLGYMIQRTLTSLLKQAGLNLSVLTVVTQVLVDRNDPDFNDPSKPIGPLYSESDAKRLSATKGYIVKKVKPSGSKAYRRVVPSPDPRGIVEKEMINRLVALGAVVIASGGGGIAVSEDKDGCLGGVEVVIDKDLAGVKLAEAVGADIFLVLSDVEKAKLNFGKPNEQDIDKLTLEEARKFQKEGHFPEGSMGPKVEACVRFLEFGGEKAIITSLDKAKMALEGKTGTLFTRD
jgi:carbamate kinase